MNKLGTVWGRPVKNVSAFAEVSAGFFITPSLNPHFGHSLSPAYTQNVSVFTHSGNARLNLNEALIYVFTQFPQRLLLPLQVLKIIKVY